MSEWKEWYEQYDGQANTRDKIRLGFNAVEKKSVTPSMETMVKFC